MSSPRGAQATKQGFKNERYPNIYDEKRATKVSFSSFNTSILPNDILNLTSVRNHLLLPLPRIKDNIPNLFPLFWRLKVNRHLVTRNPRELDVLRDGALRRPAEGPHGALALAAPQQGAQVDHQDPHGAPVLGHALGDEGVLLVLQVEVEAHRLDGGPEGVGAEGLVLHDLCFVGVSSSLFLFLPLYSPYVPPF